MAIRKFNYPTITPGDYNERTGQWENGSPYDSDLGWNNDERSGAYTRIDPNYQVPSSFNLNDLKNKSGFALNPSGEIVSYSADETLDPNNYYNELGTALVDSASQAWATNSDFSNYNNLIEGLKEVDPKAYYTTKIDFLSRQNGHYAAMNDTGRMQSVQNELQNLMPAAQKAGVTPDQINNTYQSGFSSGAKYGQQVLGAQQGSGGGVLKPFIEGAKVVGPALLGMYGLDAALTAGLGAAYGAGTGMATTGIGSGLGGAAAMEGALAGGLSGLGSTGFGLTAASVPSLTGGLEVGTGSALAGTNAGAAAVPAGGAVSSLGSLAWTPPQIGGSAGFLAPTLGADVASTGFGLTAADIPSLATGLEVGTSGALTNLDATNNLSASEILSNANKAKNLAKLIVGDSAKSATPATTGGTTGGTTGINAQQLASLLGSTLPTQSAPGGIYRMNQNPFTFGTQGQTPVSQGMYDVSGTNPMANALRKA